MSFSHNQHKITISKQTEMLSKNLDLYSSRYGSNSFFGDFYVGLSDLQMNDFCHAYNLSSPNPGNLSCIDLILRDSPCTFQGSCVVEAGLSDFHRVVVTILKTIFQRTCWNYNKFYNFSNFESLSKGVIFHKHLE